MKTSSEKIKQGQSGVRAYARDDIFHRLRRFWTLRRVGAAGDDVFIEQNVRLLRHPERIALDSHVMLKEGCRLCPTNPTASISIGAWTTVGHCTFIFAMDSITIGRDCLIAPFCYLIDSEHGIELGAPIREQPMRAKPISVGDNVWLGTGAVVTSGVNIGDGAVIGARTVVTQDVPANAVVVGVPGRIIRYRT